MVKFKVIVALQTLEISATTRPRPCHHSLNMLRLMTHHPCIIKIDKMVIYTGGYIICPCFHRLYMHVAAERCALFVVLSFRCCTVI